MPTVYTDVKFNVFCNKLTYDFKKDKEIQSLIPNSDKVKIGISWKSPEAKQDNKDISLLKMISIISW